MNSFFSVWEDPMYYESKRDTPYFLDKAASGENVLAKLLAVLRAAFMVHQTAQWQVRGSSYSDHLLLQRICEDSAPLIDKLAFGLYFVDRVSLSSQISAIQATIKYVENFLGSSELLEKSLSVEERLIQTISDTKKILEYQNALTEGLDDLLQGIASKHEDFVYLLKQRCPAYDRR